MRKKKKGNALLYVAGAAVLVLGIISLVPRSPAPDAMSGGVLTVEESSWNFGTIPMSEGIVTKDVQVSNGSSEPVTITNLETSCMCTTAQVIHEDGRKSSMKGMVGHGTTSNISETINPGEIATIQVRFDPNAHGPLATGPIMRSVTLSTNSTRQGDISLSFSGNVIR